jgi:Domain of unknown function (DUF2760)
MDTGYRQDVISLCTEQRSRMWYVKSKGASPKAATVLRVGSIVAVLLLIALNALALLPAARALQPYLLGASLALAIGLLAAFLAGRGAKISAGGVAAEAARSEPGPMQAGQAEAQVISFLTMLQEKGRLVDFVMDDIHAYNDAQVGAAARVVHAGCKAVLQEHFRIRPVRQESEGSSVQVPAGYPADEYRLLGSISGQAPFSGVLIHRGWKTDEVKLPRIVRSSAARLPAIAPAEVELGRRP